MRVGLLHWAFPPTTGGTESYLADLARLLPSRGVDVTVICGETDPIIAGNYIVKTTALLDLASLRERRGRGEETLPDTLRFIASVVADHRLDLIHGHNLHHFFPEPALALEMLRLRDGLALHHTFHETWPDILTHHPVYRNWDGNYAISAFVQRECETRIGFRPTLMTNAVDTDRFTPGPQVRPAGSRVTLLHPARILPWKGVHLSIETLAILAAEGYDLRLILTDTQRIADWNDELADYRRFLLERISELDLRDRVELRPTTFHDMVQLYRESDIVLYPTVGEEPFGLVPLEAMSCGRPVVASRSGGIVESIVDGVTGYVVERSDVKALCARVASLVDEPDLARSMGAAGRRHVLAHHAFADYLDRLMKRYESSLKVGRRSRQ